MHIAKYDKTSWKRIFRHDERSKDANGQYQARQNPDIDFSKTDQNYMISDYENPEKEVERRIAENKVRNSKTVLTFSWVIQKPDNYDGDLKVFFKTAFDAFKEHYPDNIICMYCHFDETTPHAHILGTPIKDGAFNAKAMITKADLQNIHDEIEDYLNSHGVECELTKAETKERKELIKMAKSEGIIEHDEIPKYIPMKELKARTQNKILQDYLNEKERLDEYKEMVEAYKTENSLDDLIESHKDDMIPKSEVIDMVAGIMSMVTEDLGEEKAKKYWKYLRKFKIWMKEVKDRIKEMIKDIIDR